MVKKVYVDIYGDDPVSGPDEVIIIEQVGDSEEYTVEHNGVMLPYTFLEPSISAIDIVYGALNLIE